MRGGRDIGRGCSMEVGGPAQRESECDQTMGTRDPWADNDTRHFPRIRMSGLGTRGDACAGRGRDRGGKNLEKLDLTQP